MPLNYHSFLNRSKLLLCLQGAELAIDCNLRLGYICYRQLKKQLRIGGIELGNVYIDDNQVELTTKEYFAIGDNNLLVTTSFASNAFVCTKGSK